MGEIWIQRAQVGRITDQMFTFNHYQKYFKACFIYDCSLRFFSLWFCPLDYGSLFIFDFSIFPQALGFRIFFFLTRISYLECMFNFRAPPPGMFYYYFRPYWHFQKIVYTFTGNKASNFCCAKNRTNFTHSDPHVFQP